LQSSFSKAFANSIFTVLNESQLVAKDVYRSFKIGSRKIEVLRGISLEIQRGEALFLCGASGAGIAANAVSYGSRNL